VALPKIHRLRHRQAFNTIYQVGIRCSSANFTLRAIPPRGTPKPAPIKRHEALKSEIQNSKFKIQNSKFKIYNPKSKIQNPKSKISPPLIGISISTKVHKRAVIRNRIKRRVRAIVQQFLPQISPGWQIVIVVKPTAVECDYGQFLQELRQLLEKAEVFSHGC
jgi:ribonuclease P protein component